MRKIVTVVLGGALLFAVNGFAKGGKGYVGPNDCVECHKRENKAWQKTNHYSTFKKLHRKKEAKQIAKAMGMKRIKAESACMQCHYTFKANKKAIAGISCESCHGPGKDWIDVHNDYGGKDVKKEQESAAHKKARIAKSEKAGMIRPANLYKLAQNCYECHTVPNEKLVVTGGHTPGSDFELVSWSQGEVRHNYGDGKTNRKISKERKRMMYIVGRMLDLEFGLRGVAEAKKANKYAIAMAKRTAIATGHLEKIAAATGDADIKAVHAVGKAADLKPNNKGALLAAAKKVQKLAMKFADQHDGSQFAKVDGLIPSKVIGKAMN